MMRWDIEYTDEFGAWWDRLSEAEQESIAASVQLLEEKGPLLGYPHSSEIKASRIKHLRELRTQHTGRPYRTLYAFDPRRSVILLLGGNKTGNDRWYKINIPLAEKLYDKHLEELKKQGLI